MASLLNSLLGAGDANVGARVVRAWNSNLGGSLQLQLLQLLAVLPNDKSMVLLGDGDCRRRLEEREKVFRSKLHLYHFPMEISPLIYQGTATAAEIPFNSNVGGALYICTDICRKDLCF